MGLKSRDRESVVGGRSHVRRRRAPLTAYAIREHGPVQDPSSDEQHGCVECVGGPYSDTSSRDTRLLLIIVSGICSLERIEARRTSAGTQEGGGGGVDGAPLGDGF